MLTPRKGVFAMILDALWLASGPPDKFLRLYLENLAKGA